MFNFSKHKLLSEQLVILLLKDASNPKWIIEDFQSMNFRSCSDNKNAMKEMVVLNIYCSYLAISFFFKRDESRSIRLRQLLLSKASEVFSKSFQNQEYLLVERLKEYLSILENTKNNDDYYRCITKSILDNFNEDYSNSKAAAIAGKIHGKIEGDKKIFSKVTFVD